MFVYAKKKVLCLTLLANFIVPSATHANEAVSPLILPDYQGHLGVDIQAPGGNKAQEDVPVLWNGPSATVIFMGTVSKTVDDLRTDDAHGDGYGTMLVKLQIDFDSESTFPTEVQMNDVLAEISQTNFGVKKLPSETMIGLQALPKNKALIRRLRPLLREYKKAKSLHEKKTIEEKIARDIGIRLSITTQSIVVLIGHLRPSKGFVVSSNPQERFRIGLVQKDIAYHVGSTIHNGDILGYMERDHYEGSSTAPHVHIGVYDPRLLEDPLWGIRGRNVSVTSGIREAFMRAEEVLKTLAFLAHKSK